MKRLIKGGEIVADAWIRLEDDATAPPGADVIVSLARWKAEREALAARNGGVGVRLDGADSPAELKDDLARLGVIALAFGTFKDGRAFSHARLLRERYGFKGELRAVGDVLRDQLFFMHRCGIDAYELRPDRSAEDALAAFRELSVTYQGAADDRRPLSRRAHRPSVQ